MPRARDPMGPKPSGRSILVIDDDQNIRSLVALALGRDGHSVVCATGRVEILRALEHRDFDLVITDVIMPELDGAEVTREVKKLQPHAALIAMSGGGSFMTRDFCLKLVKGMGVTTVLEKPLRLEELLCAVDRALKSSERTQP